MLAGFQILISKYCEILDAHTRTRTHTHTHKPTHLCHRLLGALIDGVLAHVHQLPEEDVPDLREASAGRFHQRLQDGADVGLDAHLQQLVRLGQHHAWGDRGRGAWVRVWLSQVNLYMNTGNAGASGWWVLLTHKTMDFISCTVAFYACTSAQG